MKRSFVFSPSRVFNTVRVFFRHIDEDRLNIFAAQASFFTVIASIPFLMLLISLARLTFPGVIESAFNELDALVPQRFSPIFDTVYNEIASKASISMISLAAITTFWSSSRGVAAVTRGIAGIYGTREHSTFSSEIVRSFFHTVAFIISIIAALIVLVFGAVIRDMCVARFPATLGVFDTIQQLKSVAFILILSLFFSVVYHAVSRNELKRGSDAAVTPRGFAAQLPGACFASVGWMLFSYFFSLYIEYFPSASYIYGSLATIVLFMLWLYFCMIILLMGAEVNKMICIHSQNKQKK